MKRYAGLLIIFLLFAGVMYGAVSCRSKPSAGVSSDKVTLDSSAESGGGASDLEQSSQGGISEAQPGTPIQTASASPGGTTGNQTGGLPLDTLRDYGSWSLNNALEAAAKYQLFFKSGEADSYVGDPMPMFDNGQFNIFHLLDERGKSNDNGFHPIGLAQSGDLTSYTDRGVVVPFTPNIAFQDAALGTGSVVKKGGVYYCFYTGHNSGLKPMEAVMSAKSSDMIGWTKTSLKIFAKDAGAGFNEDDFRDPHVVWIPGKNEYWMLVATRQSNRAVIAKYISSDLESWRYDSVMYKCEYSSVNMLECPDLFQIGNYWYLIFSTQEFTKLGGTTRYAMAQSPDGPFTEPMYNTLDSMAFYAGKTASDGKNRYLFGWVRTLRNLSNTGEQDWAGNLTVHKLIAEADGRLSLSATDAAKTLISQEKGFDDRSMLVRGDYEIKDGHYILKGGNSVLLAANMTNRLRVSGKVKYADGTSDFGLVLGSDRALTKGTYFRFAPDQGYIRSDGFASSVFANQEPGWHIRADLQPGRVSTFELVVEGSVAVIYIDGKTALSSRMYGINQGYLGFFCGKSGQAEFFDMKLYN